MYIFLSLMGLWLVFDIVRGYRKAKPTQRQQYLIRSVAGAGLVVLGLFLFGPFFMISPVKIGYATLEDNGVVLYYPATHKDRARDILAMATQAAAKNEAFYRLPSTTRVLIATSDLDMLRFGVYPKGNGGGLPWGIVIRESKASWNIIAHEMSHKNLSKFSPVTSGTLSYPRWFDEGLASYVGAMNWYRTPAELSQDIATGRYLRDITSWNGILGNLTWLRQTFGGNSHLIYGQTYLMVKYLVDSYGTDAVYRLVQAVATGTSFNTAFQKTFGTSISSFHQSFVAAIQ